MNPIGDHLKSSSTTIDSLRVETDDNVEETEFEPDSETDSESTETVSEDDEPTDVADDTDRREDDDNDDDDQEKRKFKLVFNLLNGTPDNRRGITLNIDREPLESST